MSSICQGESDEMSQIQFFFLVISLLFIAGVRGVVQEEGNYEIASERMRQKLENELQRNERTKKCDTPVLQPSTPNFQVRALLMNCPNPSCNTSNHTSNQIVVKNNNRKDSDEFTTMVNCIQKMSLTIKIKNEGRSSQTGLKSRYLVVDHVIDESTNKKMRLLNPFVVRFRQEPILQIYDLHLERLVNAEAKETVHNEENSRHYRGCDLDGRNPTCGSVTIDGKVVPYSTGFCCSCADQQVQKPFEKRDDHNNFNHYEFMDDDGKVVYDGRSPSKNTDKSVNYRQLTDHNRRNGKHQPIYRDFALHRRGGQNCNQDIDPELLQSTHCLSFSHLWYAVYILDKPRIQHKIRTQIFQKHEDCSGTTRWKDVTRGTTLISGTEHVVTTTDDGTVIVKYNSDEIDNCKFALNYKHQKLLMPERKMANPNEFMVVPKKMVDTEGKTCNTAGVGYEAFYKQQKRCSQPKGACLLNQPQHLYENDVEAEKIGEKGKYFLKYFGDLPQDEDPIGRNCTGQERDIKLLFTKEHTSVVTYEIKADYITIIQPEALATITEIYVDATNPLATNIVVKVTNSGLTYSVFYVRLGSCPMDVPANFNNIASKSVLIGPQHQHIFNLDIVESCLPQNSFSCFIYVHDTNQKLIAKRRIRFERYDRCICIWHCECACLIKDGGLTCTALTLKSYRDAGFQGGLPVSSQLVETSNLDELLASFFHTFIIFAIILLIMGLIKALLGLCSREIGMWGLDTILGIEMDPSIDSIMMCDNKNCEYRKKNDISIAAQFCLNVVFFFIYPLALINTAVKRMCFASYTEEDDECECEDIIKSDVECDDVEECKRREINRRRTSVSQESFPTASTTNTTTTADVDSVSSKSAISSRTVSSKSSISLNNNKDN